MRRWFKNNLLICCRSNYGTKFIAADVKLLTEIKNPITISLQRTYSGVFLNPQKAAMILKHLTAIGFSSCADYFLYPMRGGR
jgi:hypothetical protein